MLYLKPTPVQVLPPCLSNILSDQSLVVIVVDGVLPIQTLCSGSREIFQQRRATRTPGSEAGESLLFVTYEHLNAVEHYDVYCSCRWKTSRDSLGAMSNLLAAATNKLHSLPIDISTIMLPTYNIGGVGVFLLLLLLLIGRAVHVPDHTKG